MEVAAAVVWKSGKPVGEEAACPVCGERNFAPYGPDGRLVWWPNDKQGKWCPHCKGVYQGWKKHIFQFG